MSLAAVKTALKTRLDAIASPLVTIWGNEAYKPVTGQAYQRVFLIPAEPANQETGQHYSERGVLQVNLIFPPLDGDTNAMARAIALQAWFKRNTDMTDSGIVTTVPRTPHIGAGFTDPDDRWVVPVRIRYQAQLTG